MNNQKLRQKIKSMDEQTFRNEFSGLMSQARKYNPRMINRVVMSFNIDEGDIVNKTYTPLQKGSYINTNKEHTLSVNCDRFLSYEDMREQLVWQIR